MDRKKTIDPNRGVAYVLKSQISTAVIESAGIFSNEFTRFARGPNAVVDKLLATIEIGENGLHTGTWY